MKKKGEGNFSLSLRNNIFDSKTPTDKLPVPSFFDNTYNQETFNTERITGFFICCVTVLTLSQNYASKTILSGQ
jgi:hypothetical protein